MSFSSCYSFPSALWKPKRATKKFFQNRKKKKKWKSRKISEIVKKKKSNWEKVFKIEKTFSKSGKRFRNRKTFLSKSGKLYRNLIFFFKTDKMLFNGENFHKRSWFFLKIGNFFSKQTKTSFSLRGKMFLQLERILNHQIKVLRSIIRRCIVVCQNVKMWTFFIKSTYFLWQLQIPDTYYSKS